MRLFQVLTIVMLALVFHFHSKQSGLGSTSLAQTAPTPTPTPGGPTVNSRDPNLARTVTVRDRYNNVIRMKLSPTSGITIDGVPPTADKFQITAESEAGVPIECDCLNKVFPLGEIGEFSKTTEFMDIANALLRKAKDLKEKELRCDTGDFEDKADCFKKQISEANEDSDRDKLRKLKEKLAQLISKEIDNASDEEEIEALADLLEDKDYVEKLTTKQKSLLAKKLDAKLSKLAHAELREELDQHVKNLMDAYEANDSARVNQLRSDFIGLRNKVVSGGYSGISDRLSNIFDIQGSGGVSPAWNTEGNDNRRILLALAKGEFRTLSDIDPRAAEYGPNGRKVEAASTGGGSEGYGIRGNRGGNFQLGFPLTRARPLFGERFGGSAGDSRQDFMARFDTGSGYVNFNEELNNRNIFGDYGSSLANSNLGSPRGGRSLLGRL